MSVRGHGQQSAAEKSAGLHQQHDRHAPLPSLGAIQLPMDAREEFAAVAALREPAFQ